MTLSKWVVIRCAISQKIAEILYGRYLYYVLWLIVAVLQCSNALSQMSNLCLSLPYYNLIYHSDDEALMLMHDLSKTEGGYFEGKAFFASKFARKILTLTPQITAQARPLHFKVASYAYALDVFEKLTSSTTDLLPFFKTSTTPPTPQHCSTAQE